MMFDLPQEFLARVGVDPLTQAFASPSFGGAMMDRSLGASPKPSATSASSELWDTLPEEPLSAYINIPFCGSICPYCGFYKVLYQEDFETLYLPALVKEIEIEGNLAQKANVKLAAVFVGGGTPTVLSASGLKLLLHSIQTYLPLDSNTEITLEGRLSVLNPDKIQAIWEGGVNRLSLGIQSFHDATRKKAGRLDSGEKIQTELQKVLNSAQGIVTIDLMYGLPGQTLDIFKEDLKIGVGLRVHALSAYLTKLMPNSTYFKTSPGSLGLPQMEVLAEYFRLADAYLNDQGYTRLSPNHWRRDPRDRNLYNFLSMGRYDLIALGAGAGGFSKGRSYLNIPNLEAYRAKINAGVKPLLSLRPAPPHHDLLDLATRAILKGKLDRNLLDQKEFQSPKILKLLDNWLEAGLLEPDSSEFKLTQAGVFWRSNMENAIRGLFMLSWSI
ncbi:MAG: radical SAM protein [Deltaproteobacteria bacterium]|jgi:oxygen-independent coproporphyrinogen-3 oxidase|nr:radical SAM protein [Deltaproteobacteria bacterium]